MSVLYIEPFSGASGNMFLSVFCGLLDDYGQLLSLPEKLQLPDAKVEIKDVEKNGINCKYVEVIDLNEKEENNEPHHHGHSHEHKHSHSHKNSPHHNHRHLSDIQKIIDDAEITHKAKEIAHEIFTMIGEAESKIHDIPLEKIHFHEISGVDSIIDIVGCAVLIDRLDVSKVFCTPICTGFGMVKTQHGMLPVPAPATYELLKGMPTYKGEEKGEKVTPTGAAILKYLNPKFQEAGFPVSKIAYGPGKKDFEQPNVLRVALLESVDHSEKTEYIQLETSIDDMSPEYLGTDFQQGLLTEGAIDFGISNQLMKKGRFAILLRVLLLKEDLDRLAAYIFDNTSTIGLRYYEVKRLELKREIKRADTDLGEVSLKETLTPSQETKVKAEFEEIKALAKKLGKTPFQIINQLNTYFKK